jgi:hypothetical protein
VENVVGQAAGRGAVQEHCAIQHVERVEVPVRPHRLEAAQRLAGWATELPPRQLGRGALQHCPGGGRQCSVASAGLCQRGQHLGQAACHSAVAAPAQSRLFCRQAAVQQEQVAVLDQHLRACALASGMAAI